MTKTKTFFVNLEQGLGKTAKKFTKRYKAQESHDRRRMEKQEL